MLKAVEKCPKERLICGIQYGTMLQINTIVNRQLIPLS